jgi:TPR repeat protein
MTYSKAVKVLFTLFFVLTLTVNGAARASEPATPQGAAEFVEMLGQVAVRTSEISDQSEKKAALRNLIEVVVAASPESSDVDKAFRDFERGDYRLALKGWTVLANQGNAEGQYFLGHMYAEGLGAPQDYARAAFWFAESASQGYGHGQFALGYLYEHGWGVSKDHSNALKWYRLAADQGLAMAQNNVGLMYEEGRGVRQDYAEAHMRYSLAISLSNPNRSTAIQNLNSLIKKMTPAQTAQAERLAREWRQEYFR